jgi:hypothetical protein
MVKEGKVEGERREGRSSLQELGGVFFMARSTKSLTTNAKRRPQVCPFRPEKLHELLLCYTLIYILMESVLLSVCI